ncbi:MAG: metallophosphoesterase family protein [Bryobacteraceae bacterium]
MSGASIIGLISDTHGLLRPCALAALQGSDLIIHAGDIGNAKIIEQLHAVAPVVAVRGNIDKGAWASQLPMTAVVESGSALIYVLHDVQQLDLDPAAGAFNFVISGHSHKPSRTERCDVVYVNPGSAGPRRFQLPITVARLNLAHSPWTVDLIDLTCFEAQRYAPRDREFA